MVHLFNGKIEVLNQLMQTVGAYYQNGERGTLYSAQ